MRKLLIGAVAILSLGLGGCGDDPQHSHPLHYAKLYHDNNQHMYTYIAGTWWLFDNTNKTWVITTRPLNYSLTNYANVSTADKPSYFPALITVDNGIPGNEEYEGTKDNLEGATLEAAGEPPPAEAVGGANVGPVIAAPPDGAVQPSPPEAEEVPQEAPEATPAPEVAPAPEAVPAPSEENN